MSLKKHFDLINHIYLFHIATHIVFVPIMEFSGHTSRMTHDPTTVTARNQSFININQPINHLSILTHPERIETEPTDKSSIGVSLTPQS